MSAAVFGLSAVVGAVGEQDDYLALCLAVLQTGYSIGYAHADGCTVGDEPTLCHIHPHAVEQIEQYGMVNRHRALCIGFTCKERESDIVIGTSVDELHSHLLGGFYSVGLQIFGQHTGAHVHAEHDVDALDVLCAPVVGGLRACQGYYGQGKACEPAKERQVDEPLPERLVGMYERCCRAYRYAG